jgi:hypothetical protein
MRLHAALLFAAAAVSPVASARAVANTASQRVVFPWLCLERCGDNSSDIAEQVRQLQVNSSVFTGASFELFNLGPNATLVVNNLTRVGPAIRAAGLEAWAMVSSYPYPPEFLFYMREVFSSPDQFLADLVAAAAAYDLTGIDVRVCWLAGRRQRRVPAAR